MVGFLDSTPLAPRSRPMESLEHAGDEPMGDVFLQDELTPTIAEHATQCRSLFLKYLVMPEILEDPTIMDDQLARFTLWTSNMDVWGPLNVSLDYRLRFSPTAVDIIHQLLDIICDTLMSCKWHRLQWIEVKAKSISSTVKPIEDRPPEATSRKRQRISIECKSQPTRRSDCNISDSESDVDSAEENSFKVTETIGGTITRLFRLSNAVRRSAKANRARKIESYNDKDANKAIDELRLYTRCYLEFRFPEAPEALMSSLVEANAWRLRRLYYQRSHRKRIDMRIQSPPSTSPVVHLPKVHGNPPAVQFAPIPLPNIETRNASIHSPAPVTTATTARQTAVAALYAKSTTEVPRAKSVLVNNKLSFPSMPPDGQCTYCGVIIEFKNTAGFRLWQNHVVADLEPFICVFSQCQGRGHHGGTGPLTFETSKAWSNHMQTAHGHAWECRAPSHDPIVFEQEIDYQEHSVIEHGVPEAHARTLSRAARRPILDKVLNCPFGDDFQPPDKVESSVVFSSEALQSHVAGHMKEIALLALQKLPSNEDENNESFNSDQPLDDDGPDGFVGVARHSMYSVLEDEDLDFQDDDDIGETDDNPGRYAEEISVQVTELALDDEDKIVMMKLHHAVEAGDVTLIESVIQSGVSVDCKDENGSTPLHHAAGKGLVECMEVLLGHGADIRILDKYGSSPFIWALAAGQEDAIVKLLSLGVDINASSANGYSALAWAAVLGKVSIAQILLSRGASIHDTRNTQRTTPLENAAAFGSLALVELLIRRGADPNYRDRDGWSAMHWAAEEGHEETVSYLLKHGANPNAVSSYGTSPLHCAANGGHLLIVQLLLGVEGVDPLKATCHGWTALHHAAFKGHSHIVDLLLQDDRVRPTASFQDNHGWSALHLAVHSRDVATVLVLLNSPMIEDPQLLVDESGLTAEEWLDRGPTSHSQKAINDLAVSKSRCCQAITELRFAAAIGNAPLIKLLLRSGHHVNGVDSGKRTALYYAAKKSMRAALEILLDQGADPNILPIGQRSWEEFISDDDILQRLELAGYQRRDTDSEVVVQIRRALRERSQLLGQSEQHLPELNSWPFGEPNIFEGSFPDRLSFPKPVPPNMASSDDVTPNRITLLPIVTDQKKDNKRKARSSRANWFRRLWGGKQEHGLGLEDENE